jgi:hypothetical protein
VSEAGVILLPGEINATAEPADVEHWIGVYTELVAFCQGEGITHRRFEQRLQHWLRLRNAYCHNGNAAWPPVDQR